MVELELTTVADDEVVAYAGSEVRHYPVGVARALAVADRLHLLD